VLCGIFFRANANHELIIPKGAVLEDFESGELTSWKIVWGNLKTQPTSGTRQGIKYGHKGRFFIGTTETGGAKRSDYDDGLVGEISSKPFLVKRNFMSFLIGGGKDIHNLYIALIREKDGYIAKKSTGFEAEQMQRMFWDVSDLVGEKCRLSIVDNSKGTWGHINIDDIRIIDEMPESRFVPTLVSGGFTRIYNPSIGEDKDWYINDHCFIRGRDNQWHLFGITHEEPAKPWDEDNLAHATQGNLLQFPWKKQAFALSVKSERWDEFHLWAPHVVFHEGKYYMFYCAGDREGDKYKIHLATSRDLWKWKRHPENPVVRDGYHARDPFVMKVQNEWAMYYTATSKPEGGNHVVAYRTSRDLVHWGERKIAFTDPSVGKGGGPTESPFVVQRGDLYYLFIGPRGGYAGTDVFQSTDPFDFKPENKVGHIESHAAEVIRDLDGKWYVSHCGWGEGGVYLAPLYWNDGMDKMNCSLPIPK